MNSYIEDRVDLTLYEIKEYLDYRNKRKQGLDKEKPINFASRCAIQETKKNFFRLKASDSDAIRIHREGLGEEHPPVQVMMLL